MNKMNDLKQMSVADLRKELVSVWREKMNMRIQRGTQQPVRSHLVNQARKRVARIKTILKDKTSGVRDA